MIEINGIQTLQFSASQGNGDVIHTYFAKDDVIISVEFTDYPIANDQNNQKHIVLFRKMLSTFKFINSTGTKANMKSKTSLSETEAMELKNFVRTYLKLSSQTIIDIKMIEKDYVLGDISNPNNGGSYFAAAKVNGEWNYVMSGNGIPNCSEVEIFPIGIFKGKFDICYKDQTQLFNRKTGLVVQ